jgi:CheY-like chemotaxis protein
LGLATVYGIIKQNNGFMDVESAPGQGSTFSIYLPRQVDNVEQRHKQEAVASASRGRETILVVEDEAANLKLIRRMLERQGYTVLEAGSPREAMQAAREHAGEIQLLMTDVIMPEMNGRDLAKNLLSLDPYIKPLFMSGYPADVIANQGVLDEGVSFIQKPFSAKDLANKISETLEER